MTESTRQALVLELGKLIDRMDEDIEFMSTNLTRMIETVEKAREELVDAADQKLEHSAHVEQLDGTIEEHPSDLRE